MSSHALERSECLQILSVENVGVVGHSHQSQQSSYQGFVYLRCRGVSFGSIQSGF
jgi:hypothetical protein